MAAPRVIEIARHHLSDGSLIRITKFGREYGFMRSDPRGGPPYSLWGLKLDTARKEYADALRRDVLELEDNPKKTTPIDFAIGSKIKGGGIIKAVNRAGIAVQWPDKSMHYFSWKEIGRGEEWRHNPGAAFHEQEVLGAKNRGEITEDYTYKAMERYLASRNADYAAKSLRRGIPNPGGTMKHKKRNPSKKQVGSGLGLLLVFGGLAYAGWWALNKMKQGA